LKKTLTNAPDENLGVPTSDGFLVSNEYLMGLGNGDLRQGRRELRMLLVDLREPRRIKGPTPRPPEVRIATVADEDAVLELLRIDHRENGLRVAPFDDARCLDFIKVGTRGRGGITAVIDVGGSPIACTILIPVQWAFSRAYYMQEAFNFVHPDHRRSNHADKLIDFTKWAVDEWSRNFGYQVYLLTSVLTALRMKEKRRLYRRRANEMGALYLYPYPPGD
jgi:GNAT superfamily N-acetyltransferase